MKVEKRDPVKRENKGNGLFEAIDNLPADSSMCLRLTTAREGIGFTRITSKFARKGFKLNYQVDGDDLLIWKKTR